MPLEDVGTEEIDPVRYAEFKKWEEKKSEKKSENAMSTQGELLTKGEFLDRLEERKVSKEAKALSPAHNKVKKVARQRQKVVDEVEKEKADREKTEVEEIVKAVLAKTGFCTSKNGFIVGQDMKNFLKANKKKLGERDDFLVSLKKKDALAFLTEAFTDLDEWDWEEV